MFKPSIWLVGLLLFLITNSRFASPSAILEYRSTGIPIIDKTQLLQESRHFTSQELQIPNPTKSISEEPLEGEYYDAPVAEDKAPDYEVENSQPEDTDASINLPDRSLENSKILDTLLGRPTPSAASSEKMVLVEWENLDHSSPTELAIQESEDPEQTKSTEAKPEELVTVQWENLDHSSPTEPGIEEPEISDPEQTKSSEVNPEELIQVEWENLDHSSPTELAIEEPLAELEEQETKSSESSSEKMVAVEGEILDQSSPTESALLKELEAADLEETKSNDELVTVVWENLDHSSPTEPGKEEPEVAVLEPSKSSEITRDDLVIVELENLDHSSPTEPAEEEPEVAADPEQTKPSEATPEDLVMVDLENLDHSSPTEAAITEPEEADPEQKKSNEVILPEIEWENLDGTTSAEIPEEKSIPVHLIQSNPSDPTPADLVEEENLEQSMQTVNAVAEQDEEIESTAEPTTSPDAPYVNVASEEQGDESLEEPDSTEVALEKEVDAIIAAAMKAKSESESEAAQEMTGGENLIVATALPEESDSTEKVAIIVEENNPTGSPEPEEMDKLSVAETLISRVLTIFSTQSTLVEEHGSTEANLVPDSKETSSTESTEAAQQESDASPMGIKDVFHQVHLLAKTLKIFSTQTTPQETSIETALEANPTESVLQESNPTPLGIKDVFHKVHLLTKALNIFSTQETPLENNSAESEPEVNPTEDNSMVAVLGQSSGETVLEGSPTEEPQVILEDAETLQVEAEEGILQEVNEEGTLQEETEGGVLPEENDAGTLSKESDGLVETLDPSETPSEVNSGAALLIAASSETTEPPEEANEEVVGAAILTEADPDSTEEGDAANDVADTDANEEKADKSMGERDTNENSVVFVNGDQSAELGSGQDNRIAYMESKMTVTFVNDGDDYANDAIEGAVNVNGGTAIIPDDDSSEETTTLSPDDDNDDVTAAPAKKSKSSSSSESSSSESKGDSSESNSNSSPSNEDSSKSSSSESNSSESKETVKLELPLPTSTDAAETGSEDAPAAGSGSKESDEEATAATTTADDAEAEDNGEKDKSEENDDDDKGGEVEVDEGNAETEKQTDDDNEPADSAASLPRFDHMTIMIGGVLLCLSRMSFQQF